MNQFLSCRSECPLVILRTGVKKRPAKLYILESSGGLSWTINLTKEKG